MPYGLKKFVRYAENVWNVSSENKTDEQIAEEGLAEMEKYMNEIGLVMNLKDLGVTEDMIEAISASTLTMTGGYKVLDKNEVIRILKESL